MQETLIPNQTKKVTSTNKTLYVAIAMLSVVALVGTGMWCGPLLIDEGEILPIVGAKADVPHYINNMWTNWKLKFGKSYEIYVEEQHRIEVFYENVKFIQNFMEQDGRTFSMAINHFADLTAEEFKSLYLSEFKSKDRKDATLMRTDVPDHVDWREKGAVNPVKDQGQCGSCWAFSAIAAMEGLYFNQNQKLDSFSEQQLVDCSKNGDNDGCNGGFMDDAFTYFETNKVDKEIDYKYRGRDQQCQQSKFEGVFSNTGFTNVPANDTMQLKMALAQQVVSVAIDAEGSAFQFYSSGVFSAPCGIDLDHGVTAVGYGTDEASSETYWLVRNSWSEYWGDQGYIKMAMQTDNKEGQCGILMNAIYPTMA